MKRWPRMSWFISKDRHSGPTDRLRKVEKEEEAAVRRVISAGARATVRGGEAADTLDALLGELERRNGHYETRRR